MTRYLLYQPLHGMAVEVQILETVMLLGRILDRVVVLPLLPVVETTDYEEGLDYYFDIPRAFPWVSTAEFLRETSTINTLYKIRPFYQREYTNAAVRRSHDVWTHLIETHSYFSHLGLAVERVVSHDLERQIGDGEAADMFHSEEPVIAITYVNHLLDRSLYKVNLTRDWFRYNVTAPSSPSARFMNIARDYIGDIQYAAAHWRQSSYMAVTVKEIWRSRFPSIEEVYARIPTSYKNVYLAADHPIAEFDPGNGTNVITRNASESPNERAAVDMCLCIIAGFFVGNRYSTFSNFIYHSRTVHGMPQGSNCLIWIPA